MMMIIYYLENGKVKYITDNNGDRQSDVQIFLKQHKDKDILYYDLIVKGMEDLSTYKDGQGISGIVLPNGDFLHVRDHRHEVFAWCYEDLELDDNLILMSSDCKGGSNGMSHVSITKEEDLTDAQLSFIKKYKSKFDKRQRYDVEIGEEFGFYKRDIV